MNSKEIALFIPCYNEENRIKVEKFRNFISLNNRLLDCYFIDDGSKDNTGILISENLINHKNSFLIKLKDNLGKGNALREGILQNLDKSYSYYAFIDADLDLPLEQVKKLYLNLKDSGYLVAVSRRNIVREMNLIRLRSVSSVVMIQIANTLIRSRPRLNDTQCGCKMFARSIVETSFGKKFVSEWLFDIEIFLRLKKQYPDFRDKICEVPVSWKKDSVASNFHFRKNLKILRQIYIINSIYND